MSPRTRMLVIAGVAAAVAAGGTVALAVVTSSDEGAKPKTETPLAGAPPLVLDLGVRVDPEAKALRRAERLYSTEAPRRGRADLRALRLARGADRSRVRRLARHEPGDDRAARRGAAARLARAPAPRVRESLGWEGGRGGRRLARGPRRRSPTPPRRSGPTTRSTRTSRPASRSSCRASAHRRGSPGSSRRPSSPRSSEARRGNDAHAKLLYGLALQRLGHRISARRQYDAAARLAPRDADAQVAAAVGHFDKSRPAEAFSRLGPLARRFPQKATVRFHLGLLLLWLARNQPGSVEEAKRQLRLAQEEEPGSPLAREAKRLLAGLENVQTR